MSIYELVLVVYVAYQMKDFDKVEYQLAIKEAKVGQRLVQTKRRLHWSPRKIEISNFQLICSFNTLEHVQLNLLSKWPNLCPKFDFSTSQLFYNFIKNHSFDMQHIKLKQV